MDANTGMPDGQGFMQQLTGYAAVNGAENVMSVEDCMDQSANMGHGMVPHNVVDPQLADTTIFPEYTGQPESMDQAMDTDNLVYPLMAASNPVPHYTGQPAIAYETSPEWREAFDRQAAASPPSAGPPPAQSRRAASRQETSTRGGRRGRGRASAGGRGRGRGRGRARATANVEPVDPEPFERYEPVNHDPPPQNRAGRTRDRSREGREPPRYVPVEATQVTEAPLAAETPLVTEPPQAIESLQVSQAPQTIEAPQDIEAPHVAQAPQAAQTSQAVQAHPATQATAETGDQQVTSENGAESQRIAMGDVRPGEDDQPRSIIWVDRARYDLLLQVAYERRHETLSESAWRRIATGRHGGPFRNASWNAVRLEYSRLMRERFPGYGQDSPDAEKRRRKTDDTARRQANGEPSAVTPAELDHNVTDASTECPMNRNASRGNNNNNNGETSTTASNGLPYTDEVLA